MVASVDGCNGLVAVKGGHVALYLFGVNESHIPGGVRLQDRSLEMIERPSRLDVAVIKRVTGSQELGVVFAEGIFVSFL